MAGAKGEHVTLEVAGREVAVSNPGKVYFPEAGITKLEVVQYYLAVPRARCAARAGGRTCSSATRRHPRRVLLPEARARRRGRTGSRSSRSASPRAARPRRSCRATPRRSPGWRTSAASSCTRTRCAPRTSTIPTSCASTSTRCPASSGRRSWPWPRVVREVLAELGLVGWPKTSGSRGIHVNVRIHRRWSFDEVRRAALALAREVERRAPDARHQQVVEGGAPRRLPRLQPERQGPHGRQRLLGAPEARRARLGARDLGRARECGPRSSRCARCPRASPRSATGTPASTSTPARSSRCSSCRPRQEAEGLGDAPWPPHYAKQAGEPPASRRHGRRSAADVAGGRRVPTKPLIEIGRAQRKEDALAGLERWKARHPEAAAHLEPADVLVDSMRGRSSTWTRVRVNLEHVPEALRPAQEPLDPDDPPSCGAAPAPIGGA